MTRQRVIVVGAGIGGLVSALLLADRGLDVQVLEAAGQPGGKMRQVRAGGLLMDAGPTVFTLRAVFDELFALLGETLSAHLSLHKLDTLARHAWGPDERLDLFADVERSADAIGDFSGAAEAARYLAFTRRARAIYRTLEQPYLRSSRPNPLSLTRRVGLRGLPGLARISPFASMWNELGRYFHDPRLRQLFGRYATYCGSSPFMAPATLMLVAHVEQDGVWVIEGGMHKLARTLAGLAVRRGARFRYGAAVDEILTTGGRASGVRLASGEVMQAEAVIFNGDTAALCQGLLGAGAVSAVPASDPERRSLSAVTWSLLAPTRGFELLRHNVFFGGDYAAEFDDLFSRRRLPPRPTVYVCAQDRGEPGSAPLEAAERLLCLVNAPATGDGAATGDASRPDEHALAMCEEQCFRRLAECGLQVERSPAATLRTTPQEFHQMFPATGGALYGSASHGWLASFTRPGSRSRIEGLYLAGGSVHPGPGVPMAALSGRQAAASLLQDLGGALRRRAA